MHTATSLNLLFDPTFRLDVCEQLRRIHNAGFKYIDINFWDWGHSPNSPFMQDNWMDWVKRIKECGEELGVVFHQSHAMVYDPFTNDPKNEFLAEATRRSVIGSGMLGIEWSVFHSSKPLSPDESVESILERNHKFLDPYAELCEKHNVGMALENMSARPDNFIFPSRASELNVLVDSFKSDNVGICWDLGHAHVSGLDQYNEIKELGKRLKVLHVHDNNGQQDQHVAPFFGNINYKAFKQALCEIGYCGELTFEAHMTIRKMPDDITKAASMKLLYEIGEYIVDMEV